MTIESATYDTTASWLDGAAMRPGAEPVEPLPTIPGFPFLHRGAGAVMPGPTGSGRSNLTEVCCYDASKLGVRCAYFGSEITEAEFHARATVIAELRGDEVDDTLLAQLASARYLNLASAIAAAWVDPAAWVEGIASRYDVVILDPLSAVASALDLDFERSNSEFIAFYDKLVQPLTTRGVSVVMPDNIGHAVEAKSRAKGASAKSDRADLTFPCAKAAHGLVIKAQKVRTIRAGFQTGDSWLFDRATLQIRRQTGNDGQQSEEPAAFRPTTLMWHVSEFVESHPGVGKKDIRAGVSGRNNYVDDAIRALISESYIEQRSDARGGHHHYSIKPFRADPDKGPCPDRAPNGVPTVPTLPHSVPHVAPIPAEDRAPRAIQTKSVGHGAPSGHAPACNCQNGAADLIDGRCSRCWGAVA